MSVFLKNLLECSLVMGILTLLLSLIMPLLSKKVSAKGLYGAWLALMVGFFLLWRPHIAAPAVTIHMPVTQSYLTQAVSAPATQAAQTAPTEFARALPQVASPELTTEQVILLIWLMGIAVSLCIQLVKHLRFRRMVKRWGKPVTDEGALFVLEKVKLRMGVKRDVKLLLCPPVDSPMLIGVLRPKVLLPDLDLSDEELTLVLTHELTHMRRGDLFVKAVMLALTAVHWFNPAAYIAARSMGFYQEASCDAEVMRGADGEQRKFYSETIISIIRRQSRTKTALSTSFYAGKNGMKRRILSIMEGRGKRFSATVVCVAMLLVLGTGLAFAVSFAPEGTQTQSKAGAIAYIHCPDGAYSAPILAQPTANDLNIPASVGYPGTQVTVLGTLESSFKKAWGCKEGEDNWAQIAIAGDGETTGFSGYIPLYYLTNTKKDSALTAQVTGDAPTQYVNLYQKNSADSLVIEAVKVGTSVTLLERINKWYHVQYDGHSGFLPIENIQADEQTAQTLENALPDRFDTQSRSETEAMRAFNELVGRKTEEYGGLPLMDWSLEDKAWFGQLEETYVGSHDHYYMLPAEGDMSKEQAISEGWKTFLALTGLTGRSMSDYTFNLGFYTIPDIDPDQKLWDVTITDKNNMSFRLTLYSPQGGHQNLSKDYVSHYLENVLLNDKMAQYIERAQEWVKEKGEYYTWSLSDLAAFSAQYGDGLIVLPGEGAISEDKAVELARKAIFDQYDVTKETVDSWSPLSCYCKYVPGNTYWCSGIPGGIAEGGEACEYWEIGLYDSEGCQRTQIVLDARTGAVIEKLDPNEEGNG